MPAGQSAAGTGQLWSHRMAIEYHRKRSDWNSCRCDFAAKHGADRLLQRHPERRHVCCGGLAQSLPPACPLCTRHHRHRSVLVTISRRPTKPIQESTTLSTKRLFLALASLLLCCHYRASAATMQKQVVPLNSGWEFRQLVTGPTVVSANSAVPRRIAMASRRSSRQRSSRPAAQQAHSRSLLPRQRSQAAMDRKRRLGIPHDGAGDARAARAEER